MQKHRPYSAGAASARLLPAGMMCRITDADLLTGRGDLFQFDENGAATGADITPSACCTAPSETQGEPGTRPEKIEVTAPRHATGCMVCGAPLTYLDDERVINCSFCGQPLPASAVCTSPDYSW